MDTSCGREGAVECAVEGRESRNIGRGGRGGGVPSLDGARDDTLLADVRLEKLCIMLIVGLAKSCWSTFGLFFGDNCGVDGGFAEPVPDGAASALPVSVIDVVAFYDAWVRTVKSSMRRAVSGRAMLWVKW